MSATRSDLRVYVYACPEDQRAALVAYFADGGRLFHLNWNDSEPLPETLELDQPYTASEAPYGAVEDVAAELREVAPGIAFLAWSDPDDNGGLGWLIAFAPELGEFTAECDGSGDPVLSRSAITELIDKAGGNPGRAKAAVDAAMGGPWFDYFAGRCDECGGPLRAGEGDGNTCGPCADLAGQRAWQDEQDAATVSYKDSPS